MGHPRYTNPSKTMRDDFAQDVKRVVAQRAGNMCSNPNCGALTSGPQVDSTKALNVGVAAHITAASPGGPRYNPTLTSNERRHADNAIWLCQNCAKLVDNDPLRYTEAELRRWKSEAEAAVLSVVGKSTGPDPRSNDDQIRRLEVGARIQIRPTVPREKEGDFYQLKHDGPHYIVVHKESNGQDVDIPKTAIATLHETSDRLVLVLQGRMQWITLKQRWMFLPEEPSPSPEGALGLYKLVGLQDPSVTALSSRHHCRWFLENRVPVFLAQNWEIFYDQDGRYFRARDRPADQILIFLPD